MTKRSRTPCQRPAGWGTPHAEGKCKLHGGATPSKHGRYSKLKRSDLASIVARYEADPDPLNLEPELAVLRALFEDYIERFDEYKAAIIAWHATQNGDARPAQIMDVSDAQKILAEIGRLGERISRMRSRNAISAPELYRFVNEIERVLRTEIPDQAVLQRIARGIRQIRVQPNG